MIRLPEEFAENLRQERRRDRALANSVVRAALTGDVSAFDVAVHQLREFSVFGWRIVARKIARKTFMVSPDIQSAFQQHCIDSKSIAREVDDDRALMKMLRVLLPPYRGPAMRLFRGTGSSERRRRTYGFSWTTDPAIAELFAAPGRHYPPDAGTVVLETLAPSKAIIAAIS
jgi:hypothetical protein